MCGFWFPSKIQMVVSIALLGTHSLPPPKYCLVYKIKVFIHFSKKWNITLIKILHIQIYFKKSNSATSLIIKNSSFSYPALSRPILQRFELFLLALTSIFLSNVCILLTQCICFRHLLLKKAWFPLCKVNILLLLPI